jgi:hypothetical protein
MKKLLLLALVLFQIINLFAQDTEDFSVQGNLSFETRFIDDTMIHYWVDKRHSDFWEVKKPDGVFFDKSKIFLGFDNMISLGIENAIITNKSLMTSDIDTTIIYVKFKKDEKLHWDSLLSTRFFFYLKLDADTNESLNFYFSIDKGKSWKKAFDTAISNSFWCRDSKSSFYHKLPHSGFKEGWYEVNLTLFKYLEELFSQEADIENVRLKIEFIADKNSPTEGVMLDEFHCSYKFHSTISIKENLREKVIIESVFNRQLIYLPYPASNYKLTIFNAKGQIVYQTNFLSSNYVSLKETLNKKGLYLLRFTDNSTGEIITKKVIN